VLKIIFQVKQLYLSLNILICFRCLIQFSMYKKTISNIANTDLFLHTNLILLLTLTHEKYLTKCLIFDKLSKYTLKTKVFDDKRWEIYHVLT